MLTARKLAEELKVGDTYTSRGTQVTILRDAEPWRDRFGLELFRYWARRADTGAEGWVTFGPGGIAT